MKRKCTKNLQESRINPIVQLSKHYYRRSKHGASQIGSPYAFFKNTAILSTAPDLRSVVILKRHRENREKHFLSNLPLFWVDHYISACV